MVLYIVELLLGLRNMEVMERDIQAFEEEHDILAFVVERDKLAFEVEHDKLAFMELIRIFSLAVRQMAKLEAHILRIGVSHLLVAHNMGLDSHIIQDD